MISNLQQIWEHIRKDNLRLFIFISVVAVLLVVLVAVATNVIDARKTAQIDVLVAPRSASVKINGRSYNNGSHRVEPGNFTVVITKDGFEPYQESFSLTAGETKDLAVYLMQSDGGYDWYLAHPEDDLIMTSIGDKVAAARAAEMLTRYPILNILPYRDSDKTFDFTINPKFVDDELAALIIQLNTCSEYSKNVYKNKALLWLSNQGHNPKDYKIEITDICS
jgi:hypothetical protein